MTTLLPVPFHPHATDEDIVEAIAEYLRSCRAVSWHHASVIVLKRLSVVYGEKLVMKAGARYGRELRRERRSLKRQVARARADWLKRQ
jgi:hypothetical protein